MDYKAFNRYNEDRRLRQQKEEREARYAARQAAERDAEQAAEIAAENACPNAAEYDPEAEAFEQYEADRGCVSFEDAMRAPEGAYPGEGPLPF